MMRALLVALAWFAIGAAAYADELRVGYQKTSTLVIVKEQHRLEDAFAATGTTVRWVEFQSGPPLLEALNASAIDFGYAGDSPPVFAQAAGVDFVYFAFQPIAGRSAGVLVHKDSPARTVADLRGLKVAFVKGSSAHYQIVRTLASAGLTIADIHPVYLPPADARAAFHNGAVDAWVVWDPFFAVAERDPDNRVLTNAEIAPSNAFLLARRPFAVAHPDRVRRFLKTINDTAAWAETHQDQLAETMARVTGVDVEAQRVAAARLSYQYGPLTPEVIARQQQVADTFLDLRILPDKVEVAKAVWQSGVGQ